MYRSGALTLDPFQPHTLAFPPARGVPLSSRACRVGPPPYFPPSPAAPSALPRQRRFYPPTRGPPRVMGPPGPPCRSLGLRSRGRGGPGGVNRPFWSAPRGVPPPRGSRFLPCRGAAQRVDGPPPCGVVEPSPGDLCIGRVCGVLACGLVRVPGVVFCRI